MYLKVGRPNTQTVQFPVYPYKLKVMYNIDGLVQERHNSIAKALELHLSCTNPSICSLLILHKI